MGIVTVILIGVFAMKEPFDAMHQKRLFVLHLENVSFVFLFVEFFVFIEHYRLPPMNIISTWRPQILPLVLNSWLKI